MSQRNDKNKIYELQGKITESEKYLTKYQHLLDQNMKALATVNAIRIGSEISQKQDKINDQISNMQNIDNSLLKAKNELDSLSIEGLTGKIFQVFTSKDEQSLLESQAKQLNSTITKLNDELTKCQNIISSAFTDLAQLSEENDKISQQLSSLKSISLSRLDDFKQQFKNANRREVDLSNSSDLDQLANIIHASNRECKEVMQTHANIIKDSKEKTKQMSETQELRGKDNQYYNKLTSDEPKIKKETKIEFNPDEMENIPLDNDQKTPKP